MATKLPDDQVELIKSGLNAVYKSAGRQEADTSKPEEIRKVYAAQRVTINNLLMAIQNSKGVTLD